MVPGTVLCVPILRSLVGGHVKLTMFSFQVRGNSTQSFSARKRAAARVRKELPAKISILEDELCMKKRTLAFNTDPLMCKLTFNVREVCSDPPATCSLNVTG
jgi:hypothetical protein